MGRKCTGSDVSNDDVMRAAAYVSKGNPCDAGIIRKILYRDADAPEVGGEFKLLDMYSCIVATPSLATFVEASGAGLLAPDRGASSSVPAAQVFARKDDEDVEGLGRPMG